MALKPPIIAIDGPAGTGKSTVAKEVAKALGYVYIDTGAIYRSVALKAIRSGLTFESHSEEISKLASQSRIEFKNQGGENHIFLDSEDVSHLIRTPEVSEMASKVSSIPEVRQALLEIQRKQGESGGAVIEGRDIGTVVFPNAAFKFFLTASPEVRAKRRYLELAEKSPEVSLTESEILEQIQTRDTRDQTREHAPLIQASDAVEVDTSALDIDAVVRQIVLKVKSNVC